MTMAIGLVTTVPLVAVMMVVMKDMEKIMNAQMPAVELLYEATGSRSATIALTVLLIIIYASNLPPQWVAGGRLSWAFARDKGTPYADFFAKVDDRLKFPLRTTIATGIFCALYGLIYLASTTAFNSIITSAIFLLNLSYAIPQMIVAIRGRDKCLPIRPLNLGSWGYICNVFAPLWICVMAVLVCFPPSLPVSVGSMNYTGPILLGLFLVLLAFWYAIGKRFDGPQIDWDLLNLHNKE